MGEVIAVLNGVEFRTRHNDYGLNRPSTKNNDYHVVEKIDLPDVPPAVKEKGSVKEQAEEMRMWFKAFKESNHKLRDYRKYFRPVLCYLEGAWTITDPDKGIDEPFSSDRHFLSAIDWNELHRQIRFTSYSGNKNNGENLAFLPTTIIDMINDTIPVYAQWNYRILCHPLNKYLETNRLRVVDDLSPRLSFGRSLDSHAKSRAARFQMNPVNTGEFQEGHTTYEHLDNLMYEIPGKDNYKRYLKDESFGLRALNYVDVKKNFNAARYHRMYQVKKSGANGRSHIRRGFSDKNLFVALNTRKKVAEQTVHDQCKLNKAGEKYCLKTYRQRWSYAIPLEIIYLTPLGKWNPYDIEYNEDAVQERSRKGGKTKESAFKCAGSKHYYLTPSEFYTGKVANADAADTSKRAVGVLNKKGEVCSVMASGVHIMLPEIEGVGVVRTRYPIAPVHQEGSAIWKELQALRDLILIQEGRTKLLRAEYGLGTNLNTPYIGKDGHKVVFSMQYAPPDSGSGVTAHTHTITLTAANIQDLKRGKNINVVTSEASGHTHKLVLRYNKNSKTPYSYVTCDQRSVCWDDHGKQLRVVDN